MKSFNITVVLLCSSISSIDFFSRLPSAWIHFLFPRDVHPSRFWISEPKTQETWGCPQTTPHSWMCLSMWGILWACDTMVCPSYSPSSALSVFPWNQHRKWTICCFLWPHNTQTHTHPVVNPSLSFPNLQSCVSLLLSRKLQLHPFLQLMFWVDYTYSLWVGSVSRLCRACLKTMLPLALTSKISSRCSI